MGRPCKVDHVRDSFLRRIESTKSFVEALEELPPKGRSREKGRLHRKHLNLAYELSFLRLYSGWESLVEGTIVRYLTGAVSNGGYNPTLKNKKQNTLIEAYKIFSKNENFEIDVDYLSIGNLPKTLRKADDFFSSHPYHMFSRENEFYDYIKHAKSIRNHIAHISLSNREKFRDAATYFKIGIRQGYSPGMLLKEKMKCCPITNQKNIMIYDIYCNFFRHMSYVIVPS